MSVDPLAAASLTEAVLRSASEYAGLPAVDDGRHCLRYSDLVDQAAALADGIDRLAGPLVGLSAHRDLETYLLYVAVLFSGRTVVPIDPSASGRADRICAAAGVDFVVTSTAADRERFPDRVQVVPIAELPVGGSLATAVDLAYVLHTSGSTGAPKSVPITHRNVLAYLREVVPRYRPGPGARCSATFRLTFDPSVHDMFVTWLTGATLVLPRGREASLSVTYIQERGLTHWFSVPAAIRLAARLNMLDPRALPGLRSSLFCGEPLLLSDAAAWQAAAPQAPIENLYGPTELTVTCASYRLPADPSAWPTTANGTVPIGRPYGGLECRIDAPGETDGELLIRGPQRFGGYLGGEPLAAEDWYRTGDLVRRQPEGLVHLGRTDDQVQLGGHRVEPAEVAAAIRRFPGVTDAVVLAIPAGDGERLAAAVLGSGRLAELRAGLRRELPAYLLPDHVQAFGAFPRNAHGKVEQQVLRDQLTAGLGLCRIWSEVLETPVAPEDNFFDLGGDSLLALTIAARSRNVGLDLDAGDILEAQTPAALSGRARPLRVTPGGPTVDRVARTGRVPLLPAQARFLSRGFERPEENTVSAWFDVPTSLGVSGWRRITELLAEADDAFRVVFRDGEQVAEAGARPEYERVVYGRAGRDPEMLAQIATKVRIGRGFEGRPLLTLHHADLGGGDGRLLISAHHLIMDAVSWSHLIRRLAGWHEILCEGREPLLRPNGVPMSRWADAVAEYVAGDRRREVERWAGLPWSEVADLPLPDEEALFFAEQSADLPAELVQHLRRLGHREARARVVGALGVALSGWSGGGGALLDVVIHGRDGLRLGLDLSETFGWLATDTPVVLRPAECGDVATAARAVRQQLETAGDVEFSALRFLGEAPALTRLPQARVLVNIRDHRATGTGTFREIDAPIGPFAVERNPYAVRLAVDLYETHGRLRWRYHHAAAMAGHDALSSALAGRLQEDER